MVSAFHAWTSYRKPDSAKTEAGLPGVSLSNLTQPKVNQESASRSSAGSHKAASPDDPARIAGHLPQNSRPFPLTSDQNNNAAALTALRGQPSTIDYYADNSHSPPASDETLRAVTRPRRVQPLAVVPAMLIKPRQVTFPIMYHTPSRPPRLGIFATRDEPTTGSTDRVGAGIEDDSGIKLVATLVDVPVSVRTPEDRFVPHLVQGNFRIYEDGVEQTIDKFESTETPFHVVLLLDTSYSAQSSLRDIQRAAESFVEALRPQDEVMVVSFDSSIDVYSELTNNKTYLRNAIQQTRTGDFTKLYDAMYFAVMGILNEIPGRKAVVLLTDGVDTASLFTTAAETLELIIEAGALVYPIHYIGGYDLYRYDDSKAYLQGLANNSGGRYQEAVSIANLRQACLRIALELRQRYALSYYPKNLARDGQYRRIKVTVNQSNAVVQARKRYRAPSDVPPPDSRAR
jgi:von Willebrand factor type A domain.